MRSPRRSTPRDDISIKVSSLGVKFFLNYEKDLKGNILRSLFSKAKKKDFWALKDISFETKKGEIFGIIGGNGAGKSTLLKMMAGILPVSEGEIQAQGTVAPLIELGAAFNPELTGAENIYLSGSIYRIPQKEIRKHFDQIVEFSGLKNFIDTPIKNYSSGMFVRLAFSIIIFFQPDIVLIDEVFAVGDYTFQQKSFEKIISFREKGATIVIVSHDSTMISQICDRVLVLSRGGTSFLGDPEEAVGHYHQLMKKSTDLEADIKLDDPSTKETLSRRWGNREVEITSVVFVDENGKAKDTYDLGDYFEARISYTSNLQTGAPVFGIAINTIYKMLIYGPNTLEAECVGSYKKEGTVRFIIPSLPLFEGDYLFSAAVYDSTLKKAYDHHDMMYQFQVLSRGTRDFGCVRLEAEWKLE